MNSSGGNRSTLRTNPFRKCPLTKVPSFLVYPLTSMFAIVLNLHFAEFCTILLFVSPDPGSRFSRSGYCHLRIRTSYPISLPDGPGTWPPVAVSVSAFCKILWVLYFAGAGFCKIPPVINLTLPGLSGFLETLRSWTV